ncbi:535_t:CDS:2, partial [Gigaspora margarita]
EQVEAESSEQAEIESSVIYEMTKNLVEWLKEESFDNVNNTEKTPTYTDELSFNPWMMSVLENITSNNTMNEIKAKMDEFVTMLDDIRLKDPIMSEESIDYLKSFFEMDTFHLFPVSNKVVGIFWPSDGSSPSESLFRKLKQFNKLFGICLSVKAFVFQLSIFLSCMAISNFYDVYQKYTTFKDMPERDRYDHYDYLERLESNFDQILDALKNQSYDTQVGSLFKEVQRFINYIEKFNKQLDNNIEKLKNERFYKKIGTA